MSQILTRVHLKSWRKVLLGCRYRKKKTHKLWDLMYYHPRPSMNHPFARCGRWTVNGRPSNWPTGPTSSPQKGCRCHSLGKKKLCSWETSRGGHWGVIKIDILHHPSGIHLWCQSGACLCVCVGVLNTLPTSCACPEGVPVLI